MKGQDLEWRNGPIKLANPLSLSFSNTPYLFDIRAGKISVPKNLVINVWAFEVLIMLAIPFVCEIWHFYGDLLDGDLLGDFCPFLWHIKAQPQKLRNSPTVLLQWIYI
jgi:hypothetical protein